MKFFKMNSALYNTICEYKKLFAYKKTAYKAIKCEKKYVNPYIKVVGYSKAFAGHIGIAFSLTCIRLPSCTLLTWFNFDDFMTFNQRFHVRSILSLFYKNQQTNVYMSRLKPQKKTPR